MLFLIFSFSIASHRFAVMLGWRSPDPQHRIVSDAILFWRDSGRENRIVSDAIFFCMILTRRIASYLMQKIASHRIASIFFESQESHLMASLSHQHCIATESRRSLTKSHRIAIASHRIASSISVHRMSSSPQQIASHRIASSISRL